MRLFGGMTGTLPRRTLLGATLATGAGLRLGLRPAAASAPGTEIPTVLAAAGSPGVVEVPGFPVGHLGVSWTGATLGGRLRLRYADGWRPWRSLPATDSADPHPHPNRHRSLVAVGRAEAYEFVPAAGVHDVRLHALNTVDGPPSGRVRQPVRALTRLAAGHRPGRRFRYLSRAGWGADESLRFAPDGSEIFPPTYFDVQTLTVHHTVTANPDPDPAATVRAIYYFQAVTETWGDIGYHLLIDQAGTVYEGRYSGPDQLPVFGPRPVGTQPAMVNGAHVGGFNAGNVGVALLGDLTSVDPTPAAYDALRIVLAALAQVTGLDPLGTTDYVNPVSGATRTVRTIAGHRDWAPTECPGHAFYPDLPQLRLDVAALLDPA